MATDASRPPSPATASTLAERTLRLTQQRARMLVPIGLLLSAAVAAAAAVFLKVESDRTVLTYLTDAQSESRTLAAHALQTMKSADLVLRSVIDLANAESLASPADLRRVLGTPAIHEMLRDRQQSVPHVSVASIVDIHGDMVNFTRNFPPRSNKGELINLKERDYFQAHLRDRNLELFLSRPVLNKGTGTWTFYLARKVRSPTGEMLGVVLAGIESAYFQAFYEGVTPTGKRASLMLDDGKLLARWPPDGGTPGTDPEGPLVRRLLASSAPTAVLDLADRGSVTAPAYLIAVTRVADYPLAASMEMSEPTVMAAWHRTAISTSVLAAALMSAILVLTVMARRHLLTLADAMKELERQRQRAEVATQAKSEFIATISHEIRTPMNAVVGLTGVLAESPLDPEQRRLMRVISDSTDTLLSVVNDVLDLSELESHRVVLAPVDFEVKALVAESLDIAYGYEGAAHLSLSSHIAADVPAWVRGDRARLSRVLLNLLNNAVKYTASGSVTLSVSRAEGDQLAWSVVDTGAGIPPELHDIIFEPFERGMHSEKAIAKGTGLGLAISRKIALAMGGSLVVASTPGHGAAFTLSAPMTPAPTPRSAEAGASAPPTPTHTPHLGLKVLVAEDTKASQLVIRLALERLGCQVKVTDDGEEAVHAYQEGRFDLVLLDIQMPVLDGYGAARAIRALQVEAARLSPSRPVPPIVALSAFAQPSDRQRAFDHGMTGYLSKPFKLAQIETLVRELGLCAEATNDSAANAEPAAVAPGDLDVATLDGLLSDLGLDGFAAALEMFEQNLRMDIERLELAAAAADHERLRRGAHRLKGLLMQFGATSTARQAEALERRTDGDLPGAARALCAQAWATLPVVRAYARQRRTTA